MEPINKQDVLIRLLKEGHINVNEFKSLYESVHDVEQVFVPYYPQPTLPYYCTTNGDDITITHN